MSMLQNARAKRQGEKKKRQFQDNSNNSQKELFEKRGAFFSLSKFFENRIEYMFELLCGIDLIDAENLGIDKE